MCRRRVPTRGFLPAKSKLKRSKTVKGWLPFGLRTQGHYKSEPLLYKGKWVPEDWGLRCSRAISNKHNITHMLFLQICMWWWMRPVSTRYDPWKGYWFYVTAFFGKGYSLVFRIHLKYIKSMLLVNTSKGTGEKKKPWYVTVLPILLHKATRKKAFW